MSYFRTQLKTNYYMKSVLIASFLFFISGVYAQQHATANTNCQLDIDAILTQQSFDIDEPISEEARYIFFEMFEELNLIYLTDPNDPNMSTLLDEFEETLEKAALLNLNLAMFQQDIDHVNSLNP